MSRAEFMRELESLLLDVSLEERTEALTYYEDYFEDAGPDMEQQIIRELGTPAEVAAVIKADLSGTKTDGEYTEHGYQDNVLSRGKYEIKAKPQAQGEDTDGRDNEAGQTKEDTGRQQYSHSEQAGRYTSDHDTRKQSRVIMIILICIFALPVGLPLIITAFALAFSAVMTIGALFLTFFLGGAAIVIGGLVSAGVGITQMFIDPAVGCIVLGIGLILLGIGFLMIMFSLWVCIRVLPAFVKWIAGLCSKAFGRKRREQR